MRSTNLSIFTFLSFLFISFTAFSGNVKIDRVEPSFWWVGMHNTNLQLLLHGENIGGAHIEIDYPGVEIKALHQVENSNYLFADLVIAPEAKAGKFTINMQVENGGETKLEYELRERKEKSSQRKGFNSADVIYLTMPDRFVNGNPGNDSVNTLAEKANRNNDDGRHGGDIEGIISKLDYLQELGITAIWNTPLLQDNELTGSYHSYAISDYYKIDERFGSNEDFVNLSKECKRRGIKLIMDMVFNHCAQTHWWMNDLPGKDWVHMHDEFTPSNHRNTTIIDPYASKEDRSNFFDGWFVSCMPDLNQKNEFLLTYLIQNSIWWVEYADLGGIRMDTHPYNDPEAMAKWGQALLTEYPNLNFVGETWFKKASDIAYWQKDAPTHDGYNSQLPCVMDFQLFLALEKAFLEEQQWENGLVRLYKSLASDYVYPDKENILIFAENHDTDRIMSTLQGDLEKYKLLMTFLLTTRGIPQIYAGIEILMEGKKSDGDGKMRIDFPGGWAEDKRDAFTAAGRTSKENEAFVFLKTLLNWRKQNPVIHHGKLVHYIPENDTYVYFRSNQEKKVMIVINNGKKTNHLNLDRFAESLGQAEKGRDVITDTWFNFSNHKITVKANTALVLELK